MIESLQDFTESLPPFLQWVGVMLAGAIPFVESYFGSVIGVLAGLPTPVAIGAAVLGNILCMVVLVYGASAVRGRVARAPREESPRRTKLRRAFERYGVPGVSLLGQTILPSQITSAAMVSFGAPRNRVVLWQIISITLWGTAFGVLATLGFDAAGLASAA
ncbi:hypothetical protein [Cellulosimicrobium marinum]|uniref:hypothetical protein n=1 Tax=Cellulosimicrobium marinum TaxID=1638992 RepID=UPI001E605C8C|nr:hypothetical protein [Cellulosimicrobium marinum]MCB7135721.1 hypothetical protein [Cellulosimicrobium marinum]